MLRLCLSLLLLFLAACTQAFTPRSIAPCQAGAALGALERERSYHALLLALSERKYTVLRSDPPRALEAEYHSNYKPDEAFTRWLIEVAEDGSLRVQSIPAKTRVRRKQEFWFARLEESTRRLQCRDLNWLRWEAQNRGLTPLASGQMLSELPASAGAEAPISATPLASDAGQTAQAPPPTSPAPPALGPPPFSPEAAARTAALRRERGNIRLAGPIALLATGISLGAGAVALGQLVIRESIVGCDDEESTTCFSGRQLRNMGIGAGALGVGMAGCVAAGATLLARRLRRIRAIGGELRRLQPPMLSIMGNTHGVNLSLHGAF
jgi:hypothetical protein